MLSKLLIVVSLLLLLTACFICPPPHEADLLEPNDSLETATPIELAKPLEGNLNMGDKDIFSFEAEVGESLLLSF